MMPESLSTDALMEPFDLAADRQAIRELIESWAVWRDAGDWTRLRSVWHDDGRMIATWFEGSADQFIDICRDGWSKGMRAWHAIGGMVVDVSGPRAVAQTRTTIGQRAPVDGVLCDVVCTGRFYDFLEKRDGRWGLVLRQPIYEKDRVDPVDPAVQVRLDPTLLSQFPSGYRHLAYVQTKAGYAVNRHLPGLDGPEIAELYRQGAAWLRGDALSWRATAQPTSACPPPRQRHISSRIKTNEKTEEH